MWGPDYSAMLMISVSPSRSTVHHLLGASEVWPVPNMLVGPLPSVLHWVRPIGSMERRLEETHFYLTGSLLVGSLKTDRSSQLLSGGPPTQGLPPTPPLPAPQDLVLSPSDASPMPLLLLSIAPLLHSSKILSLFLFFCMSSSSCKVLALEPSKEIERKTRREERGREGRWKERKKP